MIKIVIETMAYEYNELSEKAKEKAFEDWVRNEGHIEVDQINKEHQDTLNAFLWMFDIGIDYWVEKSAYDFNFIWCDNVADFSKNGGALRFARWAWNHIADKIRNGEYYGLFYGGTNLKHFRRYSKNKRLNDLCLTGVYCDSDILKPIMDCLTYKKYFYSFKELMYACLDNFFKVWHKDLKYISSKDCFEKNYAKDYYYLEDGTYFQEAN